MLNGFSITSMPLPLQKKLKKHPFEKAWVHHFDLPSEMYGDPKFEQFSRVHLSMELNHETILEIGE